MSLITDNIFLLLIAIFSFYLAFAGRRFAQNRKGIASRIDWVAVGLMMLTGLGMWILALFYYIETLLRLLISTNWVPTDYLIASSAIILMSFSITIGIPQFVSRAVLQGTGNHWQASKGKIIASFISFAVGIILMIMGFGVLGVILSLAMLLMDKAKYSMYNSCFGSQKSGL